MTNQTNPQQLVFTLNRHPQFGFLVEPYLVQLDADGGYGYSYRGIASKNLSQFFSEADQQDKELALLSETMNPMEVFKKFKDKDAKNLQQFITKYYEVGKTNKLLDPVRTHVRQHLDRLRLKFLELAKHKAVCLFTKEGPPMWPKLSFSGNKAEINYSFKRNDEGLSYSLNVTSCQKTLDLSLAQTYLFSLEPTVLLHQNTFYYFDENVDGRKLQPFLSKSSISIPKEKEQEYFEQFVMKVISAGDIAAEGFDVVHSSMVPEVLLQLTEETNQVQQNLFEQSSAVILDSKMVFELYFNYERFQFRAGLGGNTVKLDYNETLPVFYKVKRNESFEKELISWFAKRGLTLGAQKLALSKDKAFDWIDKYNAELLERNIRLQQPQNMKAGAKKYFLGESVINLSINESRDWFEVKALVRFGEYEIAFRKIYNLIVSGKTEFALPNGEIAVIPEKWIEHYSGLMNFMQEDEQERIILQKHHYALVKEMQHNELLQADLNERLEKLLDLTQIDDYPMPQQFKGELRPYQKAGYNWMRFLNEYGLGGCLADDMGLGKTVQTLALLQSVKENSDQHVSLLVLPKSLIYNWHLEAYKFAPELKILLHAGNERSKTNKRFASYDLVITSYPILLRDIELFESFYFNYIVLDEAQAIKNPSSAVTKAVSSLKSKHKLVLSGTPVENSTMDLWSQMNFINPGLLGSQTFFKQNFLQAIEKRGDEQKARKLQGMISPFILRRLKTQVATELPEKTINIHYVEMSEEQQNAYEKIKADCRKMVFDSIDEVGFDKSKFMLLKGLMKLRQMANHPLLADAGYEGDSGKLEEVKEMLLNVTSEGNKVLVFSSFVQHLQLVKEFLVKEKIAFSYLDGQTNDRQYQVDRFQNDDSVKVFLISLKAGGTGLNLTKAGYVFLLDPWWNPAAEAQAIDRAHRIGQKNQVMVYKFITRDTVEEKILDLQQSKTQLSDSLIVAEDQFIKQLDATIVKDLLL
ncbi:DEAD/DEAH box helicase [Solitalea sp. MAHUQ-68]|uniref:DEAD/DEAH box helicase n=1 Tax=Solitalea agri TaxID=2953739 RepID=A0A9X2FAC9_9SPHI|nr:DEAD/DEAH box helicase [Solitalea agri]MCO4293293.1 DEAD/DEAH box helicase [Solitalea agri]